MEVSGDSVVLGFMKSSGNDLTECLRICLCTKRSESASRGALQNGVLLACDVTNAVLARANLPLQPMRATGVE